jgi:hypothetical protein
MLNKSALNQSNRPSDNRRKTGDIFGRGPRHRKRQADIVLPVLTESREGYWAGNLYTACFVVDIWCRQLLRCLYHRWNVGRTKTGALWDMSYYVCPKHGKFLRGQNPIVAQPSRFWEGFEGIASGANGSRYQRVRRRDDISNECRLRDLGKLW